MLGMLFVFVLAVMLGFEIITKVPPTLHTPLMSGSNAISGVTLVGAVIAASTGSGFWSGVFAFIAIVFATTNVVGGFLVTDRMLEKFKKKD
ncbi:MAG: NAD(P) transhydrogenase subunit alpha [Planctomycetota bacterium]